MITERKYKNALLVIKAYEEQTKNQKFEKIKELSITLDTEIETLSSHISSKLYSMLYDRKYYYYNNRPQKLSDLTNFTKAELSKWHNIGKKTVDEFVNLMAIAKHTVL